MQDTRIVLVGFDPGVARLGVAVFYWNGHRNAVPFLAELSCVRLGKGTADVAAIMRGLHSMWARLSATHMIRTDAVVVGIEQQIISSNTRVAQVEAGLQMLCLCNHIAFHAVNPAMAKRAAGLGCNGYAENKRRALVFVRDQLGYAATGPDEADAVIAVLYGCGLDIAGLQTYRDPGIADHSRVRPGIADYSDDEPGNAETDSDATPPYKEAPPAPPSTPSRCPQRPTPPEPEPAPAPSQARGRSPCFTTTPR